MARAAGRNHRLVAVRLDEESIGAGTPGQKHERDVAIRDLVAQNVFAVTDREGPYALHLALRETRLVFDVRSEQGAPLFAYILSLTPFRRVMRDYLDQCEAHEAAIRSASRARIEAIDMGRRGLHDEGARLLAERLSGKIECDHDTARRLFTLLAALHWKG
jgi:uncharacterized protein (UPF0262 family)